MLYAVVATSVILVAVIAVCVILSILVIGTIAIKWYVQFSTGLAYIRVRVLLLLITNSLLYY